MTDTETRITRRFDRPFQCGGTGSKEVEWASLEPAHFTNHHGQYVPGLYSWVPGKFAATLRKED